MLTIITIIAAHRTVQGAVGLALIHRCPSKNMTEIRVRNWPEAAMV
jgi:hypothetical protein